MQDKLTLLLGFKQMEESLLIKHETGKIQNDYCKAGD